MSKSNTASNFQGFRCRLRTDGADLLHIHRQREPKSCVTASGTCGKAIASLPRKVLIEASRTLHSLNSALWTTRGR